MAACRIEAAWLLRVLSHDHDCRRSQHKLFTVLVSFSQEEGGDQRTAEDLRMSMNKSESFSGLWSSRTRNIKKNGDRPDRMGVLGDAKSEQEEEHVESGGTTRM